MGAKKNLDHRRKRADHGYTGAKLIVLGTHLSWTRQLTHPNPLEKSGHTEVMKAYGDAVFEKGVAIQSLITRALGGAGEIKTL